MGVEDPIQELPEPVREDEGMQNGNGSGAFRDRWMVFLICGLFGGGIANDYRTSRGDMEQIEKLRTEIADHSHGRTEERINWIREDIRSIRQDLKDLRSEFKVRTASHEIQSDQNAAPKMGKLQGPNSGD